MDNSCGRIPKFRWHFGSPIFMAADGFAIARQIKCSPTFPVRVKNGTDTPSFAARPAIKSQNCGSAYIPRARSRCRLRVPGAIEAKHNFVPILGGYADQDEGPVKTVQVPPTLYLSHAKCAFFQ